MTRLDIYRKQAKQLVRWHRDGNHSIGGRIRKLARYACRCCGARCRQRAALPPPASNSWCRCKPIYSTATRS